MSVHVRLFPTLKNLSKSKQESYDVEWREGLTPRDLLVEEGFNDRDIDSCLAVINDTASKLNSPISDGDDVELRVDIQGG